MATTGCLIQQERIAAGISQQNLARAINCSKSQMSRMEAGSRSISLGVARLIEAAIGITDGRICKVLKWQRTPTSVKKHIAASQSIIEQLRDACSKGINLDQLYQSGELRQLLDKVASNMDGPLPTSKRIPLINRVAAGYPREFTDLDYPVSIADEYVLCPDVTDPDAFAARVVGSSMEPTYREGEIIVFSPVLPTPSGSDCFVRLLRDNETTFKRIYLEDDGRKIRLQPLNCEYESTCIDREDIAAMYAAAYVMRKVGL